MPDDLPLVLSGGGTTTVATDAMLADAQALAFIHFGLDASLVDLRIAAAAGESFYDLERAAIVAHRARERAQELVDAVTTAMRNYSEAEARAEDTAVTGGALAGFVGGAALSGWMLSVLGPLAAPATLAFPWLVREAMESDEPIGPDYVTVPDGVNQLLSTPEAVSALRVAVSSADEAVLGFGGAPALNELALAAVGITGVSSSALMLAGYASTAGLLVETPIGLTKVKTAPGTATSGFEQRLDKIPLPESSPGGAQIRIESITSATAAPKFEVYIGGTADFRPLADEDAFDFTSNVSGMAGLPAGSLRAVQQAMAEAGVTATSEVTFTATRKAE